jgi:organic hydroperoxide reductase OsmC/OhrA
VHRYRSNLSWRGSTAVGYESYERSHSVETPPSRSVLTLSADAAFRGDAQLSNPEQLLLAAASSCQLLSFLAVAARARIEVVAYDDEAEAVMPEDATPLRITEIWLRPQIVVSPDASIGRVERLVELAHKECYIANSLSAEVHLHATIVAAEAATR